MVDPESKDLAGRQREWAPASHEGQAGQDAAVVNHRQGGAQSQPDLRYVRRDNEDPVYVVKVKTDKLSAKFADWIRRTC